MPSHTRKKHSRRRRASYTYSAREYNSGDGMLTTVWGPAMWHYLHTMSFNFPVHPTPENKKYYRQFIYTLPHVLPCKHCRQNLAKNLRAHPLTPAHTKSRAAFSRYVYDLHEVVNKMLHKPESGLSFADVRERYEHFRSRCTEDSASKNNNPVSIPGVPGTAASSATASSETTSSATTSSETASSLDSGKKDEKKDGEEKGNTPEKKESGCTEPLYGKKSKCVINIVPQEAKAASFQMHKTCIKTRTRHKHKNSKQTRRRK